MKQKKVFIMCGPPGSGKSTWVRERLTSNDEWISRDNVRFSIVREDEDYFSHEDDVFDTFINYINQTLENPEIEYVFVDATHINYRSRHKTISRIHMKNVGELNCVCFITPLASCLDRNGKRSGRERVPDAAVANMFNSFNLPTEKEKFNHVFTVDEYGITTEV